MDWDFSDDVYNFSEEHVNHLLEKLRDEISKAQRVITVITPDLVDGMTSPIRNLEIVGLTLTWLSEAIVSLGDLQNGRHTVAHIDMAIRASVGLENTRKKLIEYLHSLGTHYYFGFDDSSESDDFLSGFDPLLN